MSDPNYDGLCGIPWRYPRKDGSYMRCNYHVGHYGKHSWEKYPEHQRGAWFTIFGGVPRRTWGNVMRRLILMKPEEWERRQEERKSKSTGDENCLENS